MYDFSTSSPERSVPGFGGGAGKKSREKRPGDEVDNF